MLKHLVKVLMGDASPPSQTLPNTAPSRKEGGNLLLLGKPPGGKALQASQLAHPPMGKLMRGCIGTDNMHCYM